jgi:hypothetical protein
MASDRARVEFVKEALSSEEIADLQVTEREVAGFYLKESNWRGVCQMARYFGLDTRMRLSLILPE